MSTAPPALEQQVRRVRRRLFLQLLLNALVWSATAALLLSAAWFVAEPFLRLGAPGWLRWAIAGSCLGCGAIAALTIAWLMTPSPTRAALALDAAFNLKERITTSLGLTEREANTAAGRALLADVNQRLTSLRVAERFPLQVSWSSRAMPLAAVAVFLVALFYHPRLGDSQTGNGVDPSADNSAVKQALEKVKRDLLQTADDKRDRPRSRNPEIAKLEEEHELLAKEGADEQAREFIKKDADLEQRMQDAERELAARNNAVRDRLNQQERMQPARLKQKKKEGPARDLQQAMQQGDFKMAQEAMDRLSKMLDPEQQKRLAEKLDKLKNKLGDDGLTPEERERIQKEMDKLGEEMLNDELRKDLQEALRDLEEALDQLTEPEKQEKALADKIEEQRKAAVDQAKQREEEQKKAEEKAKELQKKAEDLAQNPEERKRAEEELKKAEQEREKQKKEGQARQQQDERELERLRQELADMKKNDQQMGEQMRQEMKDLAKQLGDCDKAVQDGKDGEAGKKMQDARDKLRQMMGDADRQNLLRRIKQLQLARQAVCDAMNGGKGNGNGDGPANQNNRGVASGKRPIGEEGETQHFETAAPSETGKGKLRITDFIDGEGGERGTRQPVQLPQDMRIRAAQEGASALSRQRLERPGDAERVRSYFDNMRGPEKP